MKRLKQFLKKFGFLIWIKNYAIIMKITGEVKQKSYFLLKKISYIDY